MHDKIGDARETFSGFSISLSSLFVINLKFKKRSANNIILNALKCILLIFFRKGKY